MADERRPARLTSDEVAVVLRRAAEIDADDHAGEAAAADGLLDPVAVEQAAQEVGLSPTAVRQAVAELRVGALPVAAPADRAVRRNASRLVVEQRLVTGTSAVVLPRVEHFLRTQMLELRRRSGDRAIYQPRMDLVASLRRGLDFAGTIRLDGIRTVSLLTTPADDRTLVRVEAELTASRANVVGGAAAAGTGVAMFTGLGAVLAGQPELLLVALPAGAAVGAGGLRVAGARWRRRRDAVADALARMLDSL